MAQAARCGAAEPPASFCRTSASPAFISAREPVIGEQAQGFAGQILAGHLTLHQLGHDGASGDQVHHRIKRHIHEKLAGQPTGGGHLVKRDHGGAQQRGFHRHRTTCSEREIGVRHGVPAFSFDHLNRRAARGAR